MRPGCSWPPPGASTYRFQVGGASLGDKTAADDVRCEEGDAKPVRQGRLVRTQRRLRRGWQLLQPIVGDRLVPRLTKASIVADKQRAFAFPVRRVACLSSD